MKRAPLVAAFALLILLLNGCVVATSSGSGGGGGGFFVLLVPLVLFFLVFNLARRFRQGPRSTSGVSTERGPNLSMLRAELSVLADDVLRLEPQIAMHADARDDYESATHRYKVAQAALDQSEASVDLVRVQRVVDEATYAMSRARAIVDGRTPPPPPPVLQRTGSRGEPAVELDERRNPVYVGSPAPFRTGWFGVGGGLFGGLLLGSMFGGMDEWVETDDGDQYGDDDGEELT